MLDNLRRTLSAPAAVLALLAGWTLSFEAAAIWTFFVLATIVLPTLIPVVAAVVPRQIGITVRSHLGALSTDLCLALTQSLLMISFLAHQAWLMTDAITRTLTRLFVTRRHLLEWVTAARDNDRSKAGPCRLLPPDGWSGSHRRCGGDPRFGVGARDVAAHAAIGSAMDGLAGDCALDEPIT